MLYVHCERNVLVRMQGLTLDFARICLDPRQVKFFAKLMVALSRVRSLQDFILVHENYSAADVQPHPVAVAFLKRHNIFEVTASAATGDSRCRQKALLQAQTARLQVAELFEHQRTIRPRAHLKGAAEVASDSDDSAAE